MDKIVFPVAGRVPVVGLVAHAKDGADAASMVEPYATVLEHLGLGHVIQRTGNV